MTGTYSKALRLRPALLTAGCILLMALAVLQDVVQFYYYEQNAFNLLESILFESFWMLFVPLSVFAYRILPSLDSRFPDRKIYILLAATAVFSALHFLLYAFQVFSVSYLSGGHVFGFTDVLQHSLAEDLFICLLIYLTVCISVFWLKIPQNHTQIPKTGPALSSKNWLERVGFNIGTAHILIDTNDILFITASTPYSCVHTVRGKFLHQDTLKLFEEKLNPALFVRVHKSSIVNVRHVASYKSRLNGDYDLTLHNGESVRLSRNYKLNFRNLFS